MISIKANSWSYDTGIPHNNMLLWVRAEFDPAGYVQLHFLHVSKDTMDYPGNQWHLIGSLSKPVLQICFGAVHIRRIHFLTNYSVTQQTAKGEPTRYEFTQYFSRPNLMSVQSYVAGHPRKLTAPWTSEILLVETGLPSMLIFQRQPKNGSLTGSHCESKFSTMR